MKMITFKELCDQLSGEMGTTLTPDRYNTVLIQFDDGAEVQIEPVEETDEIVIGMQLGDMGSGKGRAAMFQSALIANGHPYPRFGFFAWSRKNNQLVLHEFLGMDGITGKIVKDTMTELVTKGREWKQALLHGAPPVLPRYGE